MRKIDKIIVHCTATPGGKDYTIADVERWHKTRGWRTIGYHFLIYINGTIAEGRKLSEIGAHCLGQNATSIGVCYVGGTDNLGRAKDTRTVQQKESLKILVKQLMQMYPNAKLYGHNNFSNKACPCFNVAELL